MFLGHIQVNSTWQHFLLSNCVRSIFSFISRTYQIKYCNEKNSGNIYLLSNRTLSEPIWNVKEYIPTCIFVFLLIINEASPPPEQGSGDPSLVHSSVLSFTHCFTRQIHPPLCQECAVTGTMPYPYKALTLDQNLLWVRPSWLQISSPEALSNGCSPLALRNNNSTSSYC